VPVFTTVMSTEKTIPAVTPCLSLSFMRAWSLGRHTAEQYSWSCADRALPGGGAPGGCPRCIPHADPLPERWELPDMPMSGCLGLESGRRKE
jgi:hypothetical protein